MSIETQQDLLGLMKIGQIVGESLQSLAAATRAGMTTGDLDRLAGALLAKQGARSAPQLTYDFPGVSCISVNDEAAHGVPGVRVILEGDIVKIDLSAELNGYWADAAVSVGVGQLSEERQRLMSAVYTAFQKGCEAARDGMPLNGIGQAVDTEVRSHGFSVIEELPGHGVGRKLHEEPTIPHVYIRRLKHKLRQGMVFTIEPHISTRPTRIYEAADGWTLKTRDGSITAEYEHTVIVTKEKPILVTAVM
jgi:methionyl aminopeptidase